MAQSSYATAADPPATGTALGAAVGAEPLNSDQADDDDEGKHHGVLDRRRPVLVAEELRHALQPLRHDHHPSLSSGPGWDGACPTRGRPLRPQGIRSTTRPVENPRAAGGREVDAL